MQLDNIFDFTLAHDSDQPSAATTTPLPNLIFIRVAVEWEAPGNIPANLVTDFDPDSASGIGSVTSSSARAEGENRDFLLPPCFVLYHYATEVGSGTGQATCWSVGVIMCRSYSGSRNRQFSAAASAWTPVLLTPPSSGDLNRCRSGLSNTWGCNYLRNVEMGGDG